MLYEKTARVIGAFNEANLLNVGAVRVQSLFEHGQHLVEVVHLSGLTTLIEKFEVHLV